MVHNVFSEDQFQETLKNYQTVVVDFYSTKSDKSKKVAAHFAHLYELDKFKDFRFVKVDIDDLHDLAQELGVKEPATFHFYRNGEQTGSLNTEELEELVDWLEKGL
ncbi:hypothetical protein F66182_9622 [Fusarium sp. NRRL 66182]|nr:hypothetical protein F66182_9622 [Fusarium sp. NRRL 66182]